MYVAESLIDVGDSPGPLGVVGGGNVIACQERGMYPRAVGRGAGWFAGSPNMPSGGNIPSSLR